MTHKRSSHRLKKWVFTWILLLSAAGLLIGFKILKQRAAASGPSVKELETARAASTRAAEADKEALNNNRIGFTRGRHDAPVRIEEYIDYQCPACARGHEILKDYLSRYPDKILLNVRLFPLNSHRHAWTAARFALCAAEQGKFWDAHDRLFDDQDEWSTLPEVGLFFDVMADDLGLDRDALEACMASDRSQTLVKQQKESGRRRNVSSTPTYFINGQMIVGARGLMRFLKTYFDEGRRQQP